MASPYPRQWTSGTRVSAVDRLYEENPIFATEAVTRSWVAASRSRCPLCPEHNTSGDMPRSMLEKHLLESHPSDVFRFSHGRAFVDVQAAIIESVSCFAKTNDVEKARFTYPTQHTEAYQCRRCLGHIYRPNAMSRHQTQCRAPLRKYCRSCDLFVDHFGYSSDTHEKEVRWRRRLQPDFICTPPSNLLDDINRLVVAQTSHLLPSSDVSRSNVSQTEQEKLIRERLGVPEGFQLQLRTDIHEPGWQSGPGVVLKRW